MDFDILTSPEAVFFRYSSMVLAGIGFLLMGKWSIFVYLLSLLINWITFFTIYEGRGSGSSHWYTVPIPMVVCAVTVHSWKSLK